MVKVILESPFAGDMEANAKAYKLAISHWKRIEFQKPEYLGMVANKLLNSYRELDALDEGVALLRQYFQDYKLPSLLSVVFEVTLAEQGADAAANLALNDLERKPSLQTLEQLLKARGLQSTKQSNDNSLMQQTIRYAIGNRNAYCCDQCGFKARNFHWQCPACNAWESLPAEPKETVA